MARLAPTAWLLVQSNAQQGKVDGKEVCKGVTNCDISTVLKNWGEILNVGENASQGLRNWAEGYAE
jgi:hypothetical protein